MRRNRSQGRVVYTKKCGRVHGRKKRQRMKLFGIIFILVGVLLVVFGYETKEFKEFAFFWSPFLMTVGAIFIAGGGYVFLIATQWKD